MPADPTPPQTVGPFFQPSLLGESIASLVTRETPGERIVLEGHVLDGDDRPVSDAMLEVWQANAGGRYRHPADVRDVPLDESFVGFGRSGTDAGGHFAFETIKPGPVPGPGGRWQAPHLNVLVFARGLLDRLATRIYFDDDSSLATDPFLLSLPEGRRPTLLARKEAGSSPLTYRHDVVLQGDAETVFFDG
jgi:protocatechuate 3,4-dioxygenase alpha subunit